VRCEQGEQSLRETQGGEEGGESGEGGCEGRVRVVRVFLNTNAKQFNWYML
jgi:hypothetical protein